MIAPDRKAECERFVTDLLDHMTLVEKAGQLSIRTIPPPEDRAACDHFEADLRAGRIGCIAGINSADQAERLQRIVHDETRLGIPLLFPGATGAGLTTVLPTPLALAASWSEDAVEAAEGVLAREAEASGLNWSMSPPFLMSRPSDPAVPNQSLGQEEHLAARMTAARIRGTQMLNGQYSQAMLGSLDLTEFFASPGPLAAADASRILEIVNAAVMDAAVGCIFIDGLTSDMRQTVEKAFRVLVGPGGYDGMLLPGWQQLTEQITSDTIDIRREGVPVDPLVDAVESGRIPKNRLDDVVARVLRAKFRLGLFEAAHGLGLVRGAHHLPTPIHNRETALALARRCPVLLRNDPPLLPLGIDSGEVLVVGPAASDRHFPLAGSPGIAASVIDGLEQLGIPHRFLSGLALRENGSSQRDMMAADGMAIGMAGEAARRAGTVVVVLANDQAGEFGEAQQNLLSVLAGANPRTVLVNLGPRPVDPRSQGKPLAAVLHTGALGSTSGHAIAELLSGEFSPTGKLPVAIHDNREREALPFGYGLNYADFALTNLTREFGHDRLHVFATLRNVSDREGNEVVQLYLDRPQVDRTARTRKLVHFQRMSLRPGETDTLVFDIGRDELGSYQADGSFRVESGPVELFVGLSAKRGLAIETEITADFARAVAHADIHPHRVRTA